MLDLFSSVISDEITVGTYLLCVAVALLCGIAVAAAASYRTKLTRSFLASLVLLPAIVSTVILMVNGNIGTGIAVAGAFSLVRFRSVAGKAREIVLIFLAMTSGIACAAGYIGIAVLFTALLSVGLLLLARLPLGEDRLQELHITVPETLNFTDAFEDLFAEYTKTAKLLRVKTSNMGSLYKLTYQIEMKNRGDVREMIDKLRCRNGNLEIAVMEASEGGDTL